MKTSVKHIMPIPTGHIVLSPKLERGKTVWLNRDHGGYQHRLVEFVDGTTELYLVKPNGRIVLDKRSVMVKEVRCPACGEYMNPTTYKDGRPEQDYYCCAACGHMLMFCGEVDCA